MMENNNNAAKVRMQTQDELIAALKDQCNFWRRMWAESVDMNKTMQSELNEALAERCEGFVKQCREIHDHLDKMEI